MVLLSKKVNVDKKKEKIKKYIYIYRYDIFSISFMLVIIALMLNPIYREGQIVFSDMAFGFTSERYISEIFGVWNERWSTSTLLNVPRLVYILPFYLLSSIFKFSGAVLLKSFITAIIMNSSIAMYLFSKRIVSVYFSKEFDFYKIFALVTGALFYALNPWVVFRIQHIYLLCGYSLFPLVLMFFFNVFDPRFQEQLIPNYNIFNESIYKRNLVDIFLMSIIFTISAGAIHYFFYGMIFLFIIGILILIKNLYLIRKESKKKKRVFIINILKKIGVFALCFFMLSSYWLFMYLGSILMKAQASQHNINVVDTLSLFSRNSSIKNVVYHISYWWPMFDLNSLPISFYVGGGVIIFFVVYCMLFKAYKHNIIAFFLICTLFFMITSTGTALDFFADFFIILVTKTPIIGAMFRDPNKLVGLMAVGFSLLLTFGVQSYFQRLENNKYKKVIKVSIVIIVICSFWLYLKPLYNQFIDGFYAPIDIPQEYVKVNENLIDKDSFNSKVLYFPIADNMIQSHTGVATPYWNQINKEGEIDKATGDIHVYNSQKNTVFHHEGNATSITYYINFLQYLLDKGLTKNMGTLVSAFGVNEFAYHREYKGQETRQDFNLEMLGIQENLQKHYENSIFSLYEVENSLPYLYNVGKKIFTPYGYSRLESYANMPNFNFQDFGVLFSTLDQNSYISTANEGDYIEVKDKDDIFLSNLPHENYLFPFEFINDGNAYLKWSKTLVKNNDWLWHLSSQDITNFPFDFDFGGGVALTYATSKLDVLPHNMNKIGGRVVADFDSMLREENFFVPDNPELFDVSAIPLSDTNKIPTLKGEIIKGDPNNIWQVAKTGLLDAKENNPYKFNIIVSGRGTNKTHIKVRFYNQNMEEMGVSYVVAPSEEVNFDKINFTGEYVSPPDSKYMRMDLLSYQKPEQKSYWWIHDIELLDLEEYKVPNVIELNKFFEEDTKAKVYMRTLISTKSGKMSVKIGNRITHINTLDKTLNKFEWVEVGEYEFDQGDNAIYIENISGFNAINILAFVPTEQEEYLYSPTESAIERSNIFSVLEGEYDFQYEGNIQSKRVYPKFSMGKAISSQSGIMESEIDIVKSSNYSMIMNLNATNKNNGRISLEVINLDNGHIFSSNISGDSFVTEGEEVNILVDYNPHRGLFPQEFKELPNWVNNYTEISIPNIYLEEGSYKIRIKFDSKVSSVAEFSDFHKFDSSEIELPEFIEDPYQEEYNGCSAIDFSMMRDSYKDGVYRIEYDKVCSNEWYTFASKQIPVMEEEEYIVKIEAISDTIKKRHMKVMFLDEEHKFVDVTYINDIDEKYKNQWNQYEQIVKVPLNTKYMQFHILARGDKLQGGYLEMKNFSIIPYKELISLDNLILYEGNDFENFFSSDEKIKEVTYERVDTMKRIFTLQNDDSERVLLNYIESPNPLWKISIGDNSQRGTMVLNGVTTGIITDETGNGTLEIILRKLYYISFIFVFFGIVLFIVLIKNKSNKHLRAKNHNIEFTEQTYNSR